MQILTYGCSFTEYCLGTYADILSCDYHVVNRGRSGVGNDYILFQIMEDYKKGITQDFDLTVIQWTGFTRWNYKTVSRWHGLDGSVYNTYNTESRTTWNTIKRFYNPVFEKEKFINNMILINSLFKSANIPVVQLSYEKTDLDFINIDNIFEDYKGFYKFNPTSFSKEIWTDDHPTLMQHLEIASQIASVSKNTTKHVEKIHNLILEKKEFKDYTSHFSNR